MPRTPTRVRWARVGARLISCVRSVDSTRVTTLVSILIPCHQAERWVGEAIESALAQSWPEKEVLVYDDGSTDGSADVIRSFGTRVRWESGTRRGPEGAKARLVEMSRGDWLQFLDADDLLRPEKVETQVALVADGGADLVASPGVREDGQVVNARVSDDPWVNLFHFGLGVVHGNLWRRGAVESAGGWLADPHPLGHDDYRMLHRLLRSGARVVYDPEPRAIYRSVNPASVSASVGAIAAYRAFAQLVAEWAEELDADGGMTSTRRLEASLAVMRLARRLWSLSRRDAREVADLALRIEPQLMSAMRERWPVYGAVHQAFGFGAAQRYDRLASRLRAALSRDAAAPPGGGWA